MSEMAMETRSRAGNPQELNGNHNGRLGRSNIGVDDGLLEGNHPSRYPKAPEDPHHSGVDDGLLDGNYPPRRPSLPEGGGEEGGVELDDPVSRPRPRTPPLNPWKPNERPMHPLPPSRGDDTFQFSYSTKKNIAQGMMDIALLTANASQLKYIMRSPYWDVYHKVNIALISISIILQILVGGVLIFIGRRDHKCLENCKRTHYMNDVVVSLIFAITVVNIFVATFGGDDYAMAMECNAMYESRNAVPGMQSMHRPEL